MIDELIVLSLLVTGERNLPAVAVVARLETEHLGAGRAHVGRGGGEPGEKVLVPGLAPHAGHHGASPADPGEVVLHLVKQPSRPVLHRAALPGLVATAGVAVQRVGPHLGAGALRQPEPGAGAQPHSLPVSLLVSPPPDCALELCPPEAGGNTARPGPHTALPVPTVALLPRVHQAVTALAPGWSGGQTAPLQSQH